VEGWEERLAETGETPGIFRQPTDIEVLAELERLRTGLLESISHGQHASATLTGDSVPGLQPDEKQAGKQPEDYWKSIEQETGRLKHLVTGFPHSSYLENGVPKLEKTDCRIKDILEEAARRSGVISRRHPVRIKMQPGLPLVHIDRHLIGQVFFCLVKNASRYSIEGSPIVIEARYRRGQVIIGITDRGVGIPGRLKDRVFNPCHQIQNLFSSRFSGADMGLSFCRDIIEAHNCKIRVESQVGKGSRFSFTLPVSSQEPGGGKDIRQFSEKGVM